MAHMEVAILHHTEAVDYYLETAAPKWSATSSDDHASPEQLRMLHVADMASSFWQTMALGRMSVESPMACNGDLLPTAEAQSSSSEVHGPFRPALLLRRHSKRRPRAAPAAVAGSRLEQFLRKDVQRYIDMCNPAEAEASSPAATGLLAASQVLEASHSADSKMQLLDVAGFPAGQFVCSPLSSAAPAVAVAADRIASPTTPGNAPINLPPSTGVAAVAADQLLYGNRGPSANSGMAARTIAVHLPVSATLQGTEGRSSGSGLENATASTAALHLDEDLTAQKQAARLQLAELQQAAAAATSASGDETASLEMKVSAAPLFKAAGDSAAPVGSSWLVPGRLQALAGLQQLELTQPATAAGASCTTGCLPGYGQDAQLQQYRIFQALLLGLLCCLAVFAVLWGYQAGSVDISKQCQLRQELQAAPPVLYLLGAAVALLYLFSRVVLLQPAVLHFPDRQLEHQYLLWSNSGKLYLDCMFQMLLLMVGSCLWAQLQQSSTLQGGPTPSYPRTLLNVWLLMGSGLPVVLLMLMHSSRYLAWREQLLAGSRLLSIALLCVMQAVRPAENGMQSPISMPIVVLAQLISIACMPMRLATFIPCQVLQLLVLLWKVQSPNSALQVALLLGVGLFGPCLMLYYMELYSRKAFMLTVMHSNGKKNV